MTEIINYDPETYSDLIEKILEQKDIGKLDCLTQFESDQLEKNQIGEVLKFTNELKFDTNHLKDILMVHTPKDANAYFYDCKLNLLTLKFYKR
ncbi:MAG: hypothetical protein ACOYT4_05475 [Nanoarchaeota archaeon]